MKEKFNTKAIANIYDFATLRRVGKETRQNTKRRI